jgi:hypothetical protein
MDFPVCRGGEDLCLAQWQYGKLQLFLLPAQSHTKQSGKPISADVQVLLERVSFVVSFKNDRTGHITSQSLFSFPCDFGHNESKTKTPVESAVL